MRDIFTFASIWRKSVSRGRIAPGAGIFYNPFDSIYLDIGLAVGL